MNDIARKEKSVESNERELVTQPKSLAQDLIRVVCVALFFVIAGWILHRPELRETLLSAKSLKNSGDTKDLTLVLRIIATMSILNAIGIPRIWICAIAGGIFGAIYGALIGHVCVLIGASATFAIGRYVLHGPIKRRLSPKLQKLRKKLKKNGFKCVLVIRLFPLSNSTLTNLVCGGSKVPYHQFLAGTFLGYAPLTIIFAMYGESATHKSPMLVILATGLFILTLLGGKILHSASDDRKRVS